MIDELLKKLLAAEVLTEDTKQELEQAFKTRLLEASAEARKLATEQVTLELNEQWISERETLIEALDSKITEALSEEIAELHEDIGRFRDLEAETAEVRVEMKTEMAVVLKRDIKQLIEQLDAFLEIRLSTELEEFREDIATVKKNEFGKNVFEAFVTEFKKHYAGDDSVEAKLNESEQRLADTIAALEESERKTSKLERSMKLEKVLAPLSGKNREVMEAILKNVDTALLEDAYKTYVGRVLKETSASDGKAPEKEIPVLAEGKKQKVVLNGVVKRGNNDVQLEEDVLVEAAEYKVVAFSATEKARLQRLGGVI